MYNFSNTKCWWGFEAIRTLIHCWWWHKMVHPIRNNSTVKVKHIYLFISYIPRGLLREIQTHVHIKNCIRTFIAVFFKRKKKVLILIYLWWWKEIRIPERDHLIYKGNVTWWERHMSSAKLWDEFTGGSYGNPGKGFRGQGEV